MRHLLWWCTRLQPPAFRTAFAEAILDQALHDIAQARAIGRWHAARETVRTIINLLGTAVAERLRPSWHTSRPPRKAFDMRHVLDQWRLDLVYALRALKRSPGFASVTVLTLALAIGVTAGIFSVVNAVLIRPLPFAAPQELIYVAGSAPGSDFPAEFGVSSEFFLHYRERARTVEDVALLQSFTNTLRVNDRVERIRMAASTWNTFSLLGAAPVLGRLPTEDESGRVAVISHALWQSWFGGREDVIGQAHFMGGSVREIVGVMGPEFRYPIDATLLWLTFSVREAGLVPGQFGAGMIGRLKTGVTADDAARELTTLAKELPGRFGGSAGYARLMDQYVAVVRPLAEQLVGQSSRSLWVLFGAAAFVLLIACANVANLFLVRAEGRQREMAVRQAIGAQRGQLLRVQMAETLLLALAAGLVAILFARTAVPAFLQFAPEGLPRLSEIAVDLQTILFTGALALVAGLLCGLWPAWRTSRPSLARLRDGSRSATRGRLFARHALVVAQTALALVLLIGAGLLMRSHARLSAVDPGYDTTDIFTFQIAPDQPSLTDGPTFAQFILAFADRIRVLPGVQSVGVIENVPLDEGLGSARFRTDAAADAPGTLASVTFAGLDYYQTMGIQVLAGRGFTREDATSSLGNVVISRTAARLLWPDTDPIGRKLQREGLTTWETVVGVVDDVMQENFRETATPLVYFPLQGQLPSQWRLSSPAYVVKSARADTIAADIRAIVADVAPEAPMYRTYTMADLADRVLLPLSFTTVTLAFVSALALILGAVGLYGVLSYVVSERTREIGVRLALGAQASTVRRMVVAQGARVVGIGVAIGLGVAALSTQAMGTLLFGVERFDPLTFAGTVVVMAAVGLAATYLPARRASNVDPITSLRAD